MGVVSTALYTCIVNYLIINDATAVEIYCNVTANNRVFPGKLD